MKELTRFFAAEGIILPSGASACLSTPMGEAEIDLIGQVFERFLSSRAQIFEWSPT
jgi:glutamate-1-semialdehyde 2,1-aminomutase